MTTRERMAERQRGMEAEHAARGEKAAAAIASLQVHSVAVKRCKMPSPDQQACNWATVRLVRTAVPSEEDGTTTRQSPIHEAVCRGCDGVAYITISTKGLRY